MFESDSILYKIKPDDANNSVQSQSTNLSTYEKQLVGSTIEFISAYLLQKFVTMKCSSAIILVLSFIGASLAQDNIYLGEPSQRKSHRKH